MGLVVSKGVVMRFAIASSSSVGPAIVIGGSSLVP